ncbi:MAG: phosphopentomutase [Candidatus Krumholzibacteria bacterium]|jgi:phosphopentomutase|nr:phosphopentomutase [Candidatus Krumholzibacteria bacterium]MDP6668994.1 phosphopentomutase [Candidatus Krumholzibacteria bacterium]MDP6797064.1 phosphopentomutase [Candidatus Krumholzibacteria bacterium]MDP7021084.1 phosphopentomutase [Candidatus Krumholzibacteria bacterium]
MKPRVFTVILDGLGLGDLPDSQDFGDSGRNTLAHVCEGAEGISLPAMESLGLGLVQPFAGMNPSVMPRGFRGKMLEKSRGKDSTTGHWELAGLLSPKPFPVYPEGFPPEIVRELEEVSGYRFLANRPASGTRILEELGEEHLRTGRPILYTSADPVMQIAAHEDVLDEKALYMLCQQAREIMRGPHEVTRVIARPFTGIPGAFERSPGRRDFSLEPPRATLLDLLLEAGIPVNGVGKVVDLFAGRGFSSRISSKSNEEGMEHFTRLQSEMRSPGFALVNLVDFDMLWGHRNDVEGFAEGLQVFDRWLGTFLEGMRDEDWLFLTADHGNDPTGPGTDHTREYVPILGFSPSMKSDCDLGIRRTFSDYAETVAGIFGLSPLGTGTSFLPSIREAMNG